MIGFRVPKGILNPNKREPVIAILPQDSEHISGVIENEGGHPNGHAGDNKGEV